MELQRGQKLNLADLAAPPTITADVTFDLPGLDVSVFGLNADRKLQDDRYFVFYNQPASPAGELRADLSAGRARFTLNLAALPDSVARLVFVATHDDRPVREAGTLHFTLGTGTFDPRAALTSERAVMIAEVYRHAGGWKVAAVGEGFSGGLQALLEYFGGQAEEAPPATTAPSTPAPSPAPTVSLKKQAQVRLDKQIETHAPQLVSLVKAAEVSLKKRGLDEHTARVALVLDISGSMGTLYRHGVVQRVAEKALALASRFDDDGRLDVFLFGEHAHDVGEIGIPDITGAVDRVMRRHALEGGTQYGRAMQAVRRHYLGEHKHRRAPVQQALPVYVLFVTDGETQGRDLAEEQLRDASHEPLFWKFIGVGDERFAFLQKLDDLRGRFVDNADFVAIRDVDRLSDAEFYERLLQEYDGWLSAARNRGLLP
ncbi:VWA domain-containing protein [Deinococcus maricopensis]|uniref:Stress protein n=1 Tax=Deinococcus maricopensis (strain DSM 21211 / LMG 22137 / NRRL B-23946 / LB-34) TaxID=709986 RepID=E8U9R8_DEIML|nr:VWA domain-containing protein [Deinococcus maricopensis]ADV67807.1 stress protein [Deinococcus maricopensis DSM 21211]